MRDRALRLPAAALVAFAALACNACRAETAASAPEEARLPFGSPTDAPLPAADAGPIRFLAVGDVLLARLPGRRLETGGFSWPFERVRDLVSGADVAFVNLECPASFVGAPFLGKPENVTFRADPGVLLSLKWAGFDVVGLANNHMTDFGREACAETAVLAELAGLAPCGAGADLVGARAPAVIRAGDARIAVLAYAQAGLGSVGAEPGLGGVALAREEYLAEDVASARKLADLVFVTVHWGDEHARDPNGFQRSFARAAVAAGADAVFGHHPHVVQGAELVDGRPVLYSLGNFVFDMADDPTYEGLVAVFSVENRRVTAVEIVPIVIERRTFRPSVATGTKAAAILDAFARSSRKLGLECGHDGKSEKVVFSIPPR